MKDKRSEKLIDRIVEDMGCILVTECSWSLEDDEMRPPCSQCGRIPEWDACYCCKCGTKLDIIHSTRKWFAELKSSLLQTLKKQGAEIVGGKKGSVK